MFTLGLSLFSLVFILTPFSGGLGIGRPRDWAELLFLLCVGSFLVWGLESLRSNAYLLMESEEARARLRSAMDTAPIGVLMSRRSELAPGAVLEVKVYVPLTPPSIDEENAATIVQFQA